MADTKQVIKCPACGTEMTKIYMQGASVNVDICLNGCGGILFDNREFEKFDKTEENSQEIFKAINEKNFSPVNEDEIRICPVCNTPMVKQGSGVEDVIVDICNKCGAKFLDNGEFEKIRAKANSKEHTIMNTNLFNVDSSKDKSTAPKTFSNIIKRILERV